MKRANNRPTFRREARNCAASLSLFAALAAFPAVADDDPQAPYLDDRSTGASVVESLYNAINRHEYLRAYSYFGEDAGLPDYDTYAAGYEDTDHVRLKLGEAVEEGAAGSIFTSLPVAIEATRKNGDVEVYAGCFVLRLAQPAVQGTPPFMPRHIEQAQLEPSTVDFETLNPTCETP